MKGRGWPDTQSGPAAHSGVAGQRMRAVAGFGPLGLKRD